MSLIDDMFSTCVLMEKTRVGDGSGGFITEWTEGERFDAAVVMDTTMSAKIAEQNGVTSVYTVTTRKSVVLEYHDAFKRVSDGKVFRVTSDRDDRLSPNISTLDIAQVTAEKWELT